MCSKFKPQVVVLKVVPLLRFWKTDPSLPGVVNTIVVRFWLQKGQFKISAGVCAGAPGVSPGVRRFFQPFAGIVEDGSFITLGAASYGGDSSGVVRATPGVFT